MFDRYNHLLNVIMALLITISPHFMQDHGLTAGSARKVMAEAERHAQYIIETGDSVELQQITVAAAEMEQYRPALERLAPVMDKVAARLGVSDAMNDSVSDAMAGVENVSLTGDLAADMTAPEKMQ